MVVAEAAQRSACVPGVLGMFAYQVHCALRTNRTGEHHMHSATRGNDARAFATRCHTPSYIHTYACGWWCVCKRSMYTTHMGHSE